MPRNSNRYGDGDDTPDLENPHYYHPDEQDKIDALNDGLGPKNKEPDFKEEEKKETKRQSVWEMYGGKGVAPSPTGTIPASICIECGGAKGHSRHIKCSAGWLPDDMEGRVCIRCGGIDGIHGGVCRTTEDDQC